MFLQNFSLENTGSLLTSLLLGLFGAIILIIGLYFIGYLAFLFYKFRNREKESLDSTLLQIALSRENEIKIDAAEQMFSSLASVRKTGVLSFLKNQPSISFEIVGLPGDIRFYINVPNKLRDLVEKQIHGAYPDAEITLLGDLAAKQKGIIIGDEYNIFSKTGKVAFASLKLKSSEYLPIKVYKDLPVDPLSSITSVLAKMSEGEGAAIQIIVSPADSAWKKAGRSYIAKTKKAEANPETAKYSSDAKELESIENKIGKSGFNVVIRMVVSSSTIETAKAHISNLKSIFSQFSAQNSFTSSKHLFKGFFVADFIYRYMPIRGKNSVLSSEELATLFHFPNKSVTTPNIHWMSSKKSPAPAQIPESGLFLGKSTYRGMTKPVYMGDEDRRKHMYIIGKTGVGE